MVDLGGLNDLFVGCVLKWFEGVESSSYPSCMEGIGLVIGVGKPAVG